MRSAAVTRSDPGLLPGRFEAALERETPDRRFEDVVEYLRGRDPDVVDVAAYRHGFERGQAYRRRLGEETRRPHAA